MIEPCNVVLEEGRGAGYTFTRELRHPDDRTSRASSAAVARFETDHRRYPPDSYEERNLVWRGQEWRTWSSSERAQAMGLPPDLLKSFDEFDEPVAVQNVGRCSAVGNNFHIPSLMAVLLILFQLLMPVEPRRPPAGAEMDLARRMSGTCFAPGCVDSLPGILSSADIAASMRHQLQDVKVDEDVWKQLEQQLSQVRVEELQCFTAFQLIRNRPTDVLGPTWASQRQRAYAPAASGRQRAAAASKRGLDLLLPPGLGTAKHIEHALELPTLLR